MKIILRCILLTALATIVISMAERLGTEKRTDKIIAYFKTESKKFAASALLVKEKISELNPGDLQTLQAAKQSLKNCRLHYKRIEFFVEYFLPNASMAFNRPPKTEIEEGDLELQQPVGLQVIEALLFDKKVWANKAALQLQAEIIFTSAADLNALLYNFSITGKQVMESLRLQIIRVMAMSISGYDAPQLKTGIEEAAVLLQTVKTVLIPYLENGQPYADSLLFYLDAGCDLTRQNPDFISFDRLQLLTTSLLPLQYYFSKWIKIQNLELNTVAALNHGANHLFSPDALTMAAFPNASTPVDRELIDLGGKLFFEKALSGNHQRSCASCHQPQKYFTDGLRGSKSFSGHATLPRNTPGLFYAGFQYTQFWDGRANSLEAQIRQVLENPDEMNAKSSLVIHKLENNSRYKLILRNLLAGKDTLTIDHVAGAIASYIRTLNPMNSAFDQYLHGNKQALLPRQKAGFNLFMGKAQCGTCHFLPLFNGLLPPLYDKTEFEVLGITNNQDLSKPVYDKDEGRFKVFKSLFYKAAFKTPTLRNIAETAPYMHNGAFTTLEKVIDFYNKGGGQGLKMHVPNRTLSAAPLGLKKSEIGDLISFLKSLTDTNLQ